MTCEARCASVLLGSLCMKALLFAQHIRIDAA